ncbi:YhcN/YlaJ family sporulation lipoprotein [Niallia nealsonii]|uniref:Sporulation protein n=1 Tax=Niallia nealsonii TaxID=115979 RepID=A0A2N0Z7T9_9BACI|nr:YhcN/YlaJ family sporulation lipoprotein [Niallia nealsonii]PKG25564.1 sporulation protein [Niallia nealsonii]
MKNKKKLVYFLFILSFLLAGCEKEYSSISRWALLKTVDPKPITIGGNESSSDQQVVEEIKKETSSTDGIYDVAVVKGAKNIIVAYKVEHMHRFRMKSIEKELKNKLKKNFPDEIFTVSSDFKIFLETVRLYDRVEHNQYSEKEANKRIKQIIALKKELT